MLNQSPAPHTPREIQIGDITLTLVHPDMVRIWDGYMMQARTLHFKEIEGELRDMIGGAR
jgi:hypothetical protein